MGSVSGTLFTVQRSKVANELDEVGDLLPEEQSELVLKLRYGIGLEQLMGPAMAAVVRAQQRTQRQPDWVPPAPEPAPRPDAEIRARAAALGVTAGRRGQWIR
jgi:hypothetical protein